jgi:hypothetical protein
VIDAAIRAYLDAVEQGWRDVCAARAPLSAVDRADASRFLAAITEGALTFVHADPARPCFVPWTTADRRWADNGRDSAYWYAPVDGAHRYRIHGRRRSECYLSFTVYAGSPGHPERVARNVNHRDLAAGPADPYTLEIAPPPDACYVIARQYFLDPDHDEPASLAIEAIDGPSAGLPRRGPAASPAPPDEAQIAARWRVAAEFVHAMTAPPPVAPTGVSFASMVVYEIGTPSGWTATEGGGRGTPDQTDALGRYRLDETDALVMDVRVPPCTYASAVLWNRFGQSIDTRVHRATVNHTEMTTRPDGSARVVVAHRDPGVPNWLDAGGRTQGTVFWRFLLAEAAPAPITSRVVPVADVADLTDRP